MCLANPLGAILLFQGETNLERIQSNVKGAIAGKFPLYCLGFGFDVNFEFLESMALQNDGAARRIYEDADANVQLQVFPTMKHDDRRKPNVRLEHISSARL